MGSVFDLKALFRRVAARLGRPAPAPALVVIAGREEAVPGITWPVLAESLRRDAEAHGVAYAWRWCEPGEPQDVLPLDPPFVSVSRNGGGAVVGYDVRGRRTRRRARLDPSHVLEIRPGEDALGKLREWLEGPG